MVDTSFLSSLSTTRRLSRDEAIALIGLDDPGALMQAAARRRDLAHGDDVS